MRKNANIYLLVFFMEDLNTDAAKKAATQNDPPKKARNFLKRGIRLLVHDDAGVETGNFWLDVVLNIIIIVALVFLIRTFVISPFQVSGPSMCDTLNYIDNQCQRSFGEYLIVNKFGYQNFFGWQIGMPKRGDIIVFHPPKNDSEFFIKRVIGLPGETVKLKSGEVYIFNKEHPEGYALDETYLNSVNSGNTHPYREDLTIYEIPQGNYFVLGDNRVASSDSRSCFKETPGGQPCKQGEASPYLPLDHIEGKAWLVLWPITKLAILADPAYTI